MKTMPDPSGGNFFGTDNVPFNLSGLLGLLLTTLVIAGVVAYLILALT